MNENFQIRNVIYFITVVSERTLVWTISDYFQPKGSEFNLPILYVYEDSSYSRVYIGQNKTICFHLDSRYTIRLMVNCVKNSEIIFEIQNSVPHQTKAHCFRSF